MDKTSISRNLSAFIAMLSEHALHVYSLSKEERIILHREEMNSSVEWSVLDEVELFSDCIAGYAEQASRGSLPQDIEKVGSIFSLDDRLRLWVQENRSKHPHICYYLELCDYIREVLTAAVRHPDKR